MNPKRKHGRPPRPKRKAKARGRRKARICAAAPRPPGFRLHRHDPRFAKVCCTGGLLVLAVLQTTAADLLQRAGSRLAQVAIHFAWGLWQLLR